MDEYTELWCATVTVKADHKGGFRFSIEAEREDGADTDGTVKIEHYVRTFPTGGLAARHIARRSTALRGSDKAKLRVASWRSDSEMAKGVTRDGYAGIENLYVYAIELILKEEV